MFTKFIARWRTKISQGLGLLFLFVFLFSEKKFETISPLLTGVMFICGCFLVGLATVGRLWCAQYIAGYKTDVLITDGPYSICRNPLYFFSLLGGIGAGLTTESITLAAVIVFVFCLIYPITIRNEERVLLNHFKSGYEAYMRNVPRFIPDFSLFHEPGEYTVKPKVFRREVFDALYFVWIVGLFEFIEILIEIKLIPTLFSLY